MTARNEFENTFSWMDTNRFEVHFVPVQVQKVWGEQDVQNILFSKFKLKKKKVHSIVFLPLLIEINYEVILGKIPSIC